MTFDPMSVEVTCVTLPKDHCVQAKSHDNSSMYVDTVINFAKYHIHIYYILHIYYVYTLLHYLQNEWSHTSLTELSSGETKTGCVNLKSCVQNIGQVEKNWVCICKFGCVGVRNTSYMAFWLSHCFCSFCIPCYAAMQASNKFFRRNYKVTGQSNKTAPRLNSAKECTEGWQCSKGTHQCQTQKGLASAFASLV